MSGSTQQAFPSFSHGLCWLGARVQAEDFACVVFVPLWPSNRIQCNKTSLPDYRIWLNVASKPYILWVHAPNQVLTSTRPESSYVHSSWFKFSWPQFIHTYVIYNYICHLIEFICSVKCANLLAMICVCVVL